MEGGGVFIADAPGDLVEGPASEFQMVVQGFVKVTALGAFAPTGTEPPFLAAQGLLLIAMPILGAAILRQPSALRKAASRSIA